MSALGIGSNSSLLPRPRQGPGAVGMGSRPVPPAPLLGIMAHEKEITFQTTWCHLGDAVCILTVARKFAKEHPEKVVFVDAYGDVVKAYDDNLIQAGNRGKEISHCPAGRHRRKEPADDFNYCGTYENGYGLKASPSSVPDLPKAPPFPDLVNVPYVVIQPLARWAKPDLPIPFIQKLIDLCTSAHFRVVCVGTWITRQSWETVDYSHLGYALDLMRAIQHASLVLTPRSASAHVAAAYRTRSLVWVPSDGENWHLNYKDWPNTQVSVYKPEAILAETKRMVEEALLATGQKFLDKPRPPAPAPEPIEVQAVSQPAEPKKKIRSILMTMAIGEQESKVALISHPLMMAYASKIGADFYVITERKWPDVHVYFEKYQMYERLKSYDRALYVDTDVMIRGNAPNIFDVVPAGNLGAFNEVSMAKDLTNVATDRTRILQLLELMGGPRPGWVWDGAYYNAGIQVLDPSFAWMCEKKPEGAFRDVLLGDQGILNMMIQHHKLPVFQLPIEWNHMIGHTRVSIPEACASSYFIHVTWYSNKRLRDQMMQMIASEWRSTIR